ncbi:MAG TPA: mannose-1-phosphate guanylyltransferase/mannose-6-phosphate isomerase [Sphingomicrobium sp.]|nr:mannose-1-phosphate guanylyltransferase/mannose-6-phosphate isomerase [Sphingomicrobium sp.]
MSLRNGAIIRPVILCGGAGTRLWPLSRPRLPKQFLKLAGDQSLLQQTAERLMGNRFAPSVIVSGEQQKSLIEVDLRDTDAAIEAILLEPVGRNTAAAAALAAAWLTMKGRDELVLLVPSDHVIGDLDAFHRAIEIAVPHAENGAIVTFGARPTEPNTQYGYIEAAFQGELEDAYEIARFHEKPDAGRAALYIEKGHFYWNCGIFLAMASTLTAEMQRFLPATMDAIRAAVAESQIEGRFVRPSVALFSRAENLSLDHAVMEKTARGVVVPVQMEWSDVGAWDAVWKLGLKDRDGNVTFGDVVTVDSHNSLLRADGQARIAGIGLENLCVVAVDDAIFIAPMDRLSELKDLLAKIGDRGRAEARPTKGTAPR